MFKKSSCIPLLLHVISGSCEVAFYHLRLLAGPVTPTRLDVLLCLVQSLTNLILAKPLRRGRPRMTRPCYQAGAVIRPAITLAAYALGNPNLHRSSIKILNGFVYTRVLIWLVKRLDLVQAYQDAYNLSVFGAALLAISESPINYGPHIYVCTVALVALLNQSISTRLESR